MCISRYYQITKFKYFKYLDEKNNYFVSVIFQENKIIYTKKFYYLNLQHFLEWSKYLFMLSEYSQENIFI